MVKIGISGLVLATASLLAAPQQTTSSNSQRALLDKYCVTCHNEKLHTAGLMLDRMDVGNIGANPEVWEKVLHKLTTGEMPPARLPRPDKASVDNFTSVLETSLDRAAQLSPNPGRVAIHRLNQTEYTNVIRDLLALEIDGRSLLLSDDADKQGFYNIGGLLSVSPALLERYMSSARTISRLAVGDPGISPAFETYKIPKGLNQEERVGEDMPFGSRGGIAVHHRFPLDGDYVIKVRLRKQLFDYIIGLGLPQQLEVRVNGERVKLFTVGGGDHGKTGPTMGWVGSLFGDTQWETWMHTADEALDVRFPAKAGTWPVSVSFIQDPVEPEGVVQPQTTGRGYTFNEFFDGEAAVDNISIGGPFDAHGAGETPSRRRIFVCTPKGANDQQACATKIISALARRAYRRPVTDQDIQPLLKFYADGAKQGGFEAGIQLALERLLTDPDFLFRIERNPANVAPGTVYRLSDLELASRLSFFLWSSMPDDELLDIAASGKLKNPEVLDKQVRRMLADSRSSALVDNFVWQWFNLPKLRGLLPDPSIFPDFDENLREAFEKETQLFVETQLRTDRTVLELLNANYTFVNDRLAKHYLIPGVYGTQFRRVTLSDDKRSGLLGQGSILMVTSYPNRTSPVLRGKWLMDNILGMPPPPPPPDVPALKENADGSKPTTVRARLEEHRKNAVCATCHSRIDPLGFALENFDAIGRWRDTADGAPVDSSGAMPDGTRLDGVDGLREFALNHRNQFVATFTEKLLTYALGREVEYYDLPTVRRIAREAGGGDAHWSGIISGIIKSAPFQMSVSTAPVETTAQISRRKQQ